MKRVVGLLLTLALLLCLVPTALGKDIEENPEGKTIISNTSKVITNKGTIETNRRDGKVVNNEKTGLVEDNYGTVENNNGGTVKQNESGGTININNGTVIENNGTVKISDDTGSVQTNNGTVGINASFIQTNAGTVKSNRQGSLIQTNTERGTVTENDGAVAANKGTVKENWGTVAENDGAVAANKGVVKENRGTVAENDRTVETNNGVVAVNSGTVETNNSDGTVVTNSNTVKTNNGTVGTNDSNGTVVTNNGTVTANDGAVVTNDGTVAANNGTILMNNGTIAANNGTVEINGFEGIATNSDDGSIEINLGTEISSSGKTEYGLIFANDLTPQDLTAYFNEHTVDVVKELLDDPTKIKIETKEAKSYFTLDSIALFEKDGYTQIGWFDESGAYYAFGATVYADSPYWFIPNWKAIESGSTRKPRSASVNASKVTRSIVLEVITPNIDAAENLIDGCIGVLLGNTYADMRETFPLSVKLDGKALADEQYSVIDHDDGSFTVLFSNALISALSNGTHQGVIRIGDTEIAFALTVADV